MQHNGILSVNELRVGGVHAVVYLHRGDVGSKGGVCWIGALSEVKYYGLVHNVFNPVHWPEQRKHGMIRRCVSAWGKCDRKGGVH